MPLAVGSNPGPSWRGTAAVEIGVVAAAKTLSGTGCGDTDAGRTAAVGVGVGVGVGLTDAIVAGRDRAAAGAGVGAGLRLMGVGAGVADIIACRLSAAVARLPVEATGAGEGGGVAAAICTGLRFGPS